MSKLLVIAVMGIAFFVGASAFNVGFVQGLQALIVAGDYKVQANEETTKLDPVTLDMEQLCVDAQTGAISFGDQTCNDMPLRVTEVRNKPLSVRASVATWTLPLQSNVNDYESTVSPQ